MTPTEGGTFGVSTDAATRANCSGVTDMMSSGRSAAKRGSSPACRGMLAAPAVNRPSSTAATCL